MKKGLTVLIVVLIVLGALSILSGISAANDVSTIDAGVALSIQGVGVMDHTLLVQSEWGYGGQRLTEDMYSAYKGTAGMSNISYASDLNLFIGASDTQEDVNTTQISYASTVFTTVMKRKVCAQNYEVGAVSGVKTAGISNSVLEIDMSPDANYLSYDGGIAGKVRLSHMVVDLDSRLKVIKDVTNLRGNVDVNFEAYTEKPLDVGDEGDWLGCP